MRNRFMLVAMLAAVALPTASHAQFQLGLRLGYAPAMGDAYKFKNTGDPTLEGTSAKMSDGVSSQWPMQVEGAFRITPQIAAGGYLSYGFGSGGPAFATAFAGTDFCDLSGSGVSVDCSSSTFRLGVQGTYTFTTVSPRFAPWAGLALGWEWLSAKADVSGPGVSGTFEENLNGFEFALQGGCEWKLGSLFWLGPYAQYSIGQYSGGKIKMSGFGSTPASIDFSDAADTTFHEWFNIGVRGTFDF